MLRRALVHSSVDIPLKYKAGAFGRKLQFRRHKYSVIGITHENSINQQVLCKSETPRDDRQRGS